MKAIFKWIKTSLLVLILAVIFHNWTLKTLLGLGLRLALGTAVEVEAARLDFFNQKVTFEGVLLKNPSGFQRGILAEIPSIALAFDGAELQTGRLHLREVGIEIEELRIIRAVGGKMNLLGLRVFKPSAGGREKPGLSSSAEPPRFQMDKVLVSLNRVTYTDLSGSNPLQQSFRLGIRNAVLPEASSLEAVVEAVVQESIQAAGLQKILDDAIRSFGLRNWLPESGGWKSLVAKVKESL